ncbi:MAG TPA: LysR family transcriptional regulator, partial [Polyangiaceae bacterium]
GDASFMAQLDLNDVAIFVRVVEHAGFARAARELGVPTSTVSRAISRLEETLETRLVNRNTRNVTPTSEGRTFYAAVSPAVAAVHHAARGVDGGDRAPRGRLRVSAPNDLGSTFVAGVVAAFVERYPNVAVDVELSTRRVNLVEEGFDVALRATGKLSDSSLVARKVGELEADLYASPGYVDVHGLPATVEALAEHACVLFRPRDGQDEWSLEGPKGTAIHVARGRISGDDYTFVRSAVLAGAGIAVIPRILATDDVVAGRLVRVLPLYVRRGAALHVVYAAGAKVPAKIAAFRDFLIEAFARAEAARSGAVAGAVRFSKRVAAR